MSAWLYFFSSACLYVGGYISIECFLIAVGLYVVALK